jgi:hypothetical protein
MASRRPHSWLDTGEPMGHALGHQVRQIGLLDHPVRERCGMRECLARPTGVGRALATYEIPIVGRDEWLAATRRLA